MSTVENYDGLCGIIASFGGDKNQLRCKYELSHVGAHSWEKYRQQYTIQSYCGRSDEQVAERRFIDSVIHHSK